MQTPYTDQQKRDFKEQFKMRRNRQNIVSIPVILLILAWFIYDAVYSREKSGAGPDSEFFVLGVVLVGFVAFTFLNWRCPACNGAFGRNMNIRFCRKCGVELRS